MRASWRSSIVEGSFGLVIATTILASQTIAANARPELDIPLPEVARWKYKLSTEVAPRHDIAIDLLLILTLQQ